MVPLPHTAMLLSSLTIPPSDLGLISCIESARLWRQISHAWFARSNTARRTAAIRSRSAFGFGFGRSGVVLRAIASRLRSGVCLWVVARTARAGFAQIDVFGARSFRRTVFLKRDWIAFGKRIKINPRSNTGHVKETLNAIRAGKKSKPTISDNARNGAAQYLFAHW